MFWQIIRNYHLSLDDALGSRMSAYCAISIKNVFGDDLFARAGHTGIAMSSIVLYGLLNRIELRRNRFDVFFLVGGNLFHTGVEANVLPVC